MPQLWGTAHQIIGYGLKCGQGGWVDHGVGCARKGGKADNNHDLLWEKFLSIYRTAIEHE